MALINDFDGKILLSTLWNQIGYIPCGDNESKGENAIVFNKYAPVDLITANLSYTGCSNTAMGQVIYYFLENNLLPDFNLSLNAQDVYVSWGKMPERAAVITQEGGGAANTASFAKINDLISEFISVPADPTAADYSVNSEKAAEFIAAFNFACGVLNKSTYSELSGTGAVPRLELYQRCGFKSVTCPQMISPDALERVIREENGKNVITDEGFEVLIENLLDGRPIVVGIPGHGIVLDGYDSERDMFHLNYGWGDEGGGSASEGSAVSTRWYSRKEFSDLNVQLFHYDLFGSYIEEFTVSDGRFYGTGTFLRALELATSMTGDNVISFTDKTLGTVTEIPYAYELSAGIVLKDFNITVISKIEEKDPGEANEANAETQEEEKARFMFVAMPESNIRFENFNGNAVIQAEEKELGAIFEFSGSVRTDLYFNGAKFYSGLYEKNIDDTESFFQTVAAEDIDVLMNNIKDCIVIAGSSRDDVIKFDNASFSVGNIDMCEGHNKLIVANNSRIIGDIAGDGQNRIFIDNTSNITGSLQDAAGIYIHIGKEVNSEAVFTVTGKAKETFNNILAITIDASDAAAGEYTLFSSDTSLKGFLNKLNYKLIGNGKLVVKDKDIVLQITGETAPLVQPENWKTSVKQNGSCFTFSWTEFKNVAGYSFRFANDIEALAGNGIETDTNSTELVLNNGTWYFQVRAFDANGACSDWSSAAEIVVNNTAQTVTDYYLVNGTLSNKTVNSEFSVLSGGKLENATVASSGSLIFDNGSTMTGTLTIGKNAEVEVFSGAEFIFDISSFEQENPQALINNFDAINGVFKYSLNVSGQQAFGTYILADNVEEWDFSSEISIKAGDTLIGAFSDDDDSFIYGDRCYTFIFDEKDHQLQLAVQDANSTKIEENGSIELKWRNLNGASGYIVEISNDNDFSSCLQIITEQNNLNIITSVAGEYSWRTMAVGYEDEFNVGGTFKSGKVSAKPKIFSSEESGGETNIFVASSSGVWQKGFIARNMIVAENPDGSINEVDLTGKNRYQDIFIGMPDCSNIIYLSDDSNGDALFTDDIFTAYPDEYSNTRFVLINEIYAGAGDDIIDMTSLRFETANANIVIHGGDGNDTVWAGDSSFIFGDMGNDTIVGSQKNDYISGGGGDDVLYGGGGDDYFLYGTPDSWGNDVIRQSEDGVISIVFMGDRNFLEEHDISYEYDSENNITKLYNEQGSITIYGNFDMQENIEFCRNIDEVDTAFPGFDICSSEKIFNDTNGGMLA